MTPPLRLFHAIDSEGVYGAESVLLDLCSALQQAGHHPVIASIGTYRTGVKPIEAAAGERGLEVHAVRMSAGPSLRGALRLAELARREHADVIHVHGYKANILLATLPRRVRGRPLVVTVHGYTDVQWWDRLALYNRIDRLLLRRADRVVLVHQGMTDKPGLNRLHDPRWSVIENGISLGAPDRRAAAPPALLASITGRGPVIGAVGRLSFEKGFDILLRAVTPILHRNPRGVVVIVGDGPEKMSLRRQASELQIADRLVLPGYVPNARLVMPLFDLFVLPSRTEGLPVTLLEAMYAGVPTVAARVGGVSAVLDNGLGGWLVQAGNADDLSSAMAESLADGKLARARAAHARRVVTERFSREAMAQRYVALYRALSHGTPGRAVPGPPRAGR